MDYEKHIRAWLPYFGWGRGVCLGYYEQNEGRISQATTLTITTASEAEERKHFLFLDPTMAQELMDDLWQCGVRPSEGSGSAGALAATQRHLDDMRALVFQAQSLTAAKKP